MTNLNEPASPAVLPVSPDPVRRVPNPGSDEALSAGCLCPVAENNEGRAVPNPPGEWLTAAGCPVHEPRHGEAGEAA